MKIYCLLLDILVMVPNCALFMTSCSTVLSAQNWNVAGEFSLLIALKRHCDLSIVIAQKKIDASHSPEKCFVCELQLQVLGWRVKM